MQALPVGRRRLALDAAEHAVELRKRLESRLKGRLAHALVGIEHEVLDLLDAHPGEILRERHARRLLERLAKIEGAHVHGPCHVAEGNLVRMMLRNVDAGPRDGGRLGGLASYYELVAHAPSGEHT